ncbi:MAG: DNA-directed RNA polymerase subunit L [Euryarchaeota archaeon]|nr:DNA-directed RNA polymerase subunit L [Euryarchaeota archaeon]MBV1730379.1 DNA-directed RNA polymerase subunit L [Methanobacterium sp.]MBU4548326.1 DNA-directed RNA polymerase subunit L [Euryarchaeota archaeon]MBU4608733.1 DNA-directed RNA polymerase subunit L [Euryarchaeota archaeon]MBV1755389.1 DNA-directed RNA polymerase subunit L [Methanobacterium sp.]
MEIITSKRYELEILVEGETHTLCNALRKILMEDETVKSAAYAIEHPIVGEPKLYIKSKSPKKSLKIAAETLKERCEEFKGLLESIE